jgi:hypothetical protein
MSIQANGCLGPNSYFYNLKVLGGTSGKSGFAETRHNIANYSYFAPKFCENM